MPSPSKPNSIAIVGGGLAGLAAAAAAVEHGFHVELFEQAIHVGGRAGSYRDKEADRLVDLSPHVAMGCCTNLIQFCQATGIEGGFVRHSLLHFFGPDGTQYEFKPSHWLPAPLHLMPALRGLGYLTRRDQRGIGKAMLRLARYRLPDSPDASTMGQWLLVQRQSKNAVRLFWAVVLESALGDSLDHVSVTAAKKVFVDGFMAAKSSYEVLIARLPLGELWQRAATWLSGQGVKIHTKARIASLKFEEGRVAGVEIADGQFHSFDHTVAAVAWKQLPKLLGDALLAAVPEAASAAELESSPVTAVHLWYDQRWTNLPHAAIVGRLSQWLFEGPQGIRHTLAESPGIESAAFASAFHCTVVISASHALLGRGTTTVLAEVLDDLASIWPESRAAKLLHHRVLTQPSAVFSARPGTDAMRPPQGTAVPGLFLAGDWTATGWPATMEGAVRSGNLAIEAVLVACGRPATVLTPDLPKGFLIRWIAR